MNIFQMCGIFMEKSCMKSLRECILMQVSMQQLQGVSYIDIHTTFEIVKRNISVNILLYDIHECKIDTYEVRKVCIVYVNPYGTTNWDSMCWYTCSTQLFEV